MVGFQRIRKTATVPGARVVPVFVAVLVFGDMVADDLREVNRKFTPGWGKIGT